MPVRNEARNLWDTVQAVLAQHYEGELDIWIAVAPSDDGTEQLVEEMVLTQTNVFSIYNHAGVAPAGLNAAIAASNGEIVVRVDGHVTLPSGYISQAVRVLQETGAVNVGGRQLAVGRSSFERAVAAVMMSVVGSGGAEYRVGSTAKSVDTVFLGVFDRSAGDAVGWFDERLIRNQDYELNIRLRAAGGLVWFDPSLVVEYQPRSTLRSLARQYFDYGRFKAVVLRMHGSSIRLRQLLPPVTMAVLAMSLIVSTMFPIFLGVSVGYVVAIGFAVQGPARTRLWSIVIAPLIHTCWSAGLMLGFLASRRGALN